MIDNFDKLMKATEQERSKMTKTELLSAISNYSFYYQQNIDGIKEAKDALVTQSKQEEAVKGLLVSYLGLPATKEQNGYDYEIKYTLLDLVGKVLAIK